ncbi:cyclic nucleotide-gated channel beta-1-like [Paroedura picta]|uniref:cyclic nucleotide-gated channel beta-1-like n=1 Tax=Paroedura picta TaxID=143630 RepID=UPI004056B81E
MLSWIERVVPQPPAIPPTPVVVETAVKPELKTKVSKSGRSRKKLLEKKSSRPTSEKKDSVVTPDPVPTTESSGRGVLTWLSEGFVKVVPQPSPRPVCQKDSKTSDAANQTDAQNVVEDEKKEATGTPDPASTAEGSGRGVLTWLSEGLEKVVPQPTEPGIILHRDSKTSDAANQTEVQKNVEDEGKLDPSKPSGVEGEVQPSSDTNAPETAGTKTVFNRLMEEFEKMIPQPDVAKKAEVTLKMRPRRRIPQTSLCPRTMTT